MAQLTMLAEMMDHDLSAAVNDLKELGIRQLDLKNHVFDRSIDDLDDERRAQLAALIEVTATEIYCFSSTAGHENVSQMGERAFRRKLADGIDNMLRTAERVRPRMIRLLACKFDTRENVTDGNDYLERHLPWVYAAYRDSVDQIDDAGIVTTIENEPNTIFSTPEETVAFFERLDRGTKVGMTWDIQNMWQSGTYPTRDVYRTLRPVINYVHLKGGRSTPKAPFELTYRSPLANASWPVREIVGQVLADGVSPVICLNPSHGVPPKDYAFASIWGTQHLAGAEARCDLAFIRKTFPMLS